MGVDISRQQLVALVEKVEECAPGVGEGTGAGTDVLIGHTIDATLAVVNGIEDGAKEGWGAAQCVAVMTQGACAAMLDAMPPGDIRSQLNRAGRAVGRFIADRFAEKIREQLPKEKPDA